MKHQTRFSDSSFYDTVCTACGGTDAAGDDRLKHPCEGSETAGDRARAERRVARAREALADAERELASQQ